MKILLAAESSEDGTKVKEIFIPDNSRMSPNIPWHGWWEIKTPAGSLYWIQGIYMIGLVPNDS